MTSRTIGLSILALIVVAAASWALYVNNRLSAALSPGADMTSVDVGTSTAGVSPVPDPTATDTGPIYSSGDTVTVTAHIGQSVRALGETITPTALVDDSRCPTDVQCVWAGTVHIKATIISGMGTSTITLELGKELTTEVNSILLESVAPAKVSTHEISSGDYVLTFKVTRR